MGHSSHLQFVQLILRSVSDSLEYSPERCTVVACYKRLVVGVAILSSPQETYITYLAVKAGWDKAQIARLVSDRVLISDSPFTDAPFSQDYALSFNQNESEERHYLARLGEQFGNGKVV